MSLAAMTWALTDAPVEDATALLILISLCERAHDDGSSAYPAVGWLAQRARCSSRTVHRHLRTLEDRGVIVRGDQELVSHFRHDRRPVVWDVPGVRGDRVSRRERPNGVTSRVERGDTVVTQTVLPPTEETVRTSSSTVVDGALSMEFEQFWRTYPRKVGKQAAFAVYVRLRRRGILHTDILDGAQRYRDDPNRGQGQFVPHPTTWLNRGGWEDEPEPVRAAVNGRLSANDAVQQTLALADRLGQQSITGAGPWGQIGAGT